MSVLRVVIILLLVLGAGCVQHHAHRAAGEEAQLRSWMRILEVDGAPPEDPFLVMLPPGRHQALAVYPTVRNDYLCRFEFDVVGGASYEIVDHSNPEPLVLYRWVRANGVWAERLDPVHPTCESRPRER